MEIVLAFAYQYLEYIVVGLSGIGVIGYMKLKNIESKRNNLSRFIIKHKKYEAMLNKTIKPTK